jgi:hypothetical protein
LLLLYYNVLTPDLSYFSDPDSREMSSKLIPNKYQVLTHYILDHYNKRLQCESCQTTWTSDGTAFMRDQGGSKDGMYYRQFRCKGKGKGKCSMAYTHEDFLALATRQLGTMQIEAIKHECGFSLSVTTDTPLNKRGHDGASTGYTPQTKRISSFVHPVVPPPVYPPNIPPKPDLPSTVHRSRLFDSHLGSHLLSSPTLADENRFTRGDIEAQE